MRVAEVKNTGRLSEDEDASIELALLVIGWAAKGGRLAILARIDRFFLLMRFRQCLYWIDGASARGTGSILQGLSQMRTSDLLGLFQVCQGAGHLEQAVGGA